MKKRWVGDNYEEEKKITNINFIININNTASNYYLSSI